MQQGGAVLAWADKDHLLLWEGGMPSDRLDSQGPGCGDSVGGLHEGIG